MARHAIRLSARVQRPLTKHGTRRCISIMQRPRCATSYCTDHGAATRKKLATNGERLRVNTKQWCYIAGQADPSPTRQQTMFHSPSRRAHCCTTRSSGSGSDSPYTTKSADEPSTTITEEYVPGVLYISVEQEERRREVLLRERVGVE